MRRPQRVREPGKLMAYSNYSTALAGAIVAEVSGMEYESYVERNILVPLGLAHTTFREQYAADARLAAADVRRPRHAPGAEHRDAQRRMAVDPARAHRLDGACGRRGLDRRGHGELHARVARPGSDSKQRACSRRETFARMREPSFQSAPGMPAIHHGFFNAPLGVTTQLGVDNLSHSGATLHFRSFMVVTDDLSISRASKERSASSSARTAPRR